VRNLFTVIDGRQDADTKLGDFRSSSTFMTALGGSKTNSATDYTYDNNGNLLKDRNKDIGNEATDGIVYNHLNLPYKIWIKGKGYLTYVYDAAGNKLEKRVVDSATSQVTVTKYLGGSVYRNDTLQFLSHEEGRIRRNSDNVFIYDYFVKDHLGNTRMVLTDEQQTDPYPAVSLEAGSLATDTLYYDVNPSNIVDNPLWLPSPYANNNGNPPYNTNPSINTSANSQKMYKLNGAAGVRTGLGITLKVMAGDEVGIYGKSIWHGSTPNNGYKPVVNTLLAALAGTGAIAGSGKGITEAALIGSPLTPSDVNDFINSAPAVSGGPKAYINWILFDERFRVDTASSGFDPVSSTPDVIKPHSPVVSISKNGYLYVYVSNESDSSVYFDNLQVLHLRGPLLEETHYYPFGLTMAGISSKAAGKLENKYKLFGKELQSKEFSDGSGLEWYDYGMREYDQQIGRFFRVDPLTEKFYYLSPYQYCSNNPISNVDLDGAEGLDFRIFQKLVQNTVQNPNGTSAKILGAATGVGGSVQGAINAVANPKQTVKALGHMLTQSPYQNAAESASNAAQQYASQSDDFTNFAMASHAATDIFLSASPFKGVLGKSGGLKPEGLIGEKPIVSLKGYNDALGLAKTTGGDFAKAAEATREFAGKIDADFVSNLKSEGTVTIEGLKQYNTQLKDAISNFKELKKDYSVQQARMETIEKVIKLWEDKK
jgi:RHS repeat-associated protein